MLKCFINNHVTIIKFGIMHMRVHAQTKTHALERIHVLGHADKDART